MFYTSLVKQALKLRVDKPVSCGAVCPVRVGRACGYFLRAQHVLLAKSAGGKDRHFQWQGFGGVDARSPQGNSAW